MTVPLQNWLLLRFLIAVGFVFFVVVLGGWWSAYELNADEGINLQKAVLVSKGNSLYSDIWSDQPPFLSWVLSVVHTVTPFNLPVMRIVILGFSLLLLTSLFGLVRRFHGDFAAWTSVVLLIFTAPFLELSVAVMIGLPAIALALVSLDIATSSRGAWKTMMAGVVFAAALMTKFFVAVILPALFLAVWFTAQHSPNSDRKTPWMQLLWLSFGIALVVGSWLLAAPFDALMSQLISPHTAARSGEEFSSLGGPGKLARSLLKVSDPVIWSLPFGLFAIYAKPGRAILIPILWFVASVVALATHRPLWHHHLLLITPPLVWMCAVGISAVIWPAAQEPVAKRLLSNEIRWVRISARGALAVLGAGIIAGGIGEIAAARRAFTGLAERQAQIAQLSLRLFDTAKSDTLVTDKPIDAFHVKKKSPLNLAVLSRKRLATGNLTGLDVEDALLDHPEADVLIRRFPDQLGPHIKLKEPFLRVGQIVDRYTDEGFVRYVRSEPLAPLESELIGSLRALTSSTLGGVSDPSNAQRFDRPHGKLLHPGAVVTRPKGSAQEIGACLLAASEATNSRLLLFESVGIAAALHAVQTQHGGWTKWAVPSGSPSEILSGSETFDDGTLASIVLFAYDLADALKRRDLPEMTWLDEMADRAMAFIVDSQLEDGGWPQSLSRGRYHPLATLNDDASTGLIRLLLRAYKRTGRQSYLQAARRGGDFLLKVQSAGKQAGFAQQYSPSLKPAPARKFEPVAYASLETGYAINALVDLYLATGDAKYRKSAERAASWLQGRQLSPDLWARFYDVVDGHPLYSQRAGGITSHIEDIPEGERRQYRWIGGRAVFPEIGEALDRIAALTQGEAKLAVYDKELAGRALLSQVPSARLPLDPSRAELHPQAGDSRAFAEWCAGLVARELPR